MPANNKHIIQIKNLVIGYQSKQQQTVVVSDIDLSIPKGSFVCILGKNGIGKSTLLRTITKVQPRLSGTILIDKKPLESISTSELAKKMSLVLTERIPDSNLTIYELIALGRQPYTNWIGKLQADDILKIDWAIEQLHIKDVLNKRHDELSDGQLQKVMIARALVQDTELIILDEPTVHLDLHNTIEIFSILKRLCLEHHKTIIISTHQIQLALQLADNLCLLNTKGVLFGKTQTLIDNGSVANLFDSDLIKFDSKTKQFIHLL